MTSGNTGIKLGTFPAINYSTKEKFFSPNMYRNIHLFNVLMCSTHLRIFDLNKFDLEILHPINLFDFWTTPDNIYERDPYSKSKKSKT
jgi:hypothetical protein